MHEARFEQWSVRLCAVLAAALQEVASVLGDSHTFAALDLGCFPWHGSLELSLLTAAEFQADPGLKDVEEVASWQYQAISDDLGSWRGAVGLEQSMKAAYDGSGQERQRVARGFMRACARAMADPGVQSALCLLSRHSQFRVYVVHPDTGESFYPLESTDVP